MTKNDEVVDVEDEICLFFLFSFLHFLNFLDLDSLSNPFLDLNLPDLDLDILFYSINLDYWS